MARSDEAFLKALENKKIPLLTLDNKWHQIFSQLDTTGKMDIHINQLNELLKRQGKLISETKEIKKIKARLMDEIVGLMDSMDDGDPAREKKLEENKRLINECNEKVDSYQDELLDLPKEIQKINKTLMMESMRVCYDTLENNTKDIEEIAQWITRIRIDLKKKVIRKQEKEIKNHELYAYMHDIFGADVIELFDMKYNPEENKITK